MSSTVSKTGDVGGAEIPTIRIMVNACQGETSGICGSGVHDLQCLRLVCPTRALSHEGGSEIPTRRCQYLGDLHHIKNIADKQGIVFWGMTRRVRQRV